MKIGFVINPYAGLGGAVALKGSDGRDIVELALSRGAKPHAQERAAIAMQILAEHESRSGLSICCAGGNMGEDVLQQAGLPCTVVYRAGEHSRAEDTRKTVAQFIEQHVDLVIFTGGDGTARDVLDVLAGDKAGSIPVIGIPAGVKIHSAVYASTPSRAGELIDMIASGEPVSLHESPVMDLDEQAFREGSVRARCYGYLSVPVDDSRMQLSKQGGLNHEEIALQDIATEVIETMKDDVYYLIGSGSTTAEIMQQLDLPNTLLGVDIIKDQQLLASDVDEHTILDTIDKHATRIVVTVIGGQGHVFGRGNQQISPEVIRRVSGESSGRENIIIIASEEKLRSLDKRPMIADTGDTELDKKLRGLYPVVTGYQQKTLYRLN